MKYTFILLCVFIIRTTVGQTTYQTSINYKNNSSVTQMISTADGGSTIVGYTPNGDCEFYSQCKAHAFAYHFNNKGVATWNKIYTSFNLGYSRIVAAKTFDEGFILFGRLYDTLRNEAKGGLLVKCDKNGSVEWTKQILSKYHDFFEPQLIGQDNQGNFLLLTILDYFDGASLQIIKLNNAGNVLWNTTLTLGGFGNPFVVTTFLQNGNKYYISGFETCEECEPRLQTASLITINTEGKVLSLKSIRTKNDINYYISATVNKLFVHNQFLYTYGYCDEAFIFPMTDTTTSVVASVIPDGSFGLQHYLRKFKNIFPFQLDNLTYFDNNKSMKALYGSTLQQYDSLNRICPDFVIPKVDTTISNRLFSIEEGHIYLQTDSVYSQNKNVTVSSDSISYTLICSGDAQKNVNQNESNIADVNNKRISIFPNPSNEIIHVSGMRSGITSIEIFSSIGLREKLITTTLTNIDINIPDLIKGIYFIKITEQNKASYLSSFIKR